jgi:hypothetical protein
MSNEFEHTACPLGFIIFTVLVSTSTPGFSETPEEEKQLVTDRPDVTESSTTVPTSHLQLEAGTRGSFETRQSTFHPVSLLGRYGVAEDVEVRMSFTPATVYFPADERSRSTLLDEVRFGGKLATELSDNLRVGVIPWFSGYELAANPRWGAGALGTFAFDLSSSVGLGANAGVSSVPAGNRRTVEFSGSLAVGVDLTNHLGTYLEAYGVTSLDGLVEYYSDAGFTYLVTPRLQLDAYLDTSLPEFDRIGVGLGASILL